MSDKHKVIQIRDFMPKPCDDEATMCEFEMKFLGSVADALKFIEILRDNGGGELAEEILQESAVFELVDP